MKKTAAQKQEQNTEGLIEFLTKQSETWATHGKLALKDRVGFIEELLSGDSLRDLQKAPVTEASAVVADLWKNFLVRPFENIHIDVQEDTFGHAGRVDITIMQRQIPFITDSILNLLRYHHLTINTMLNATIKVRRDDDGRLLSIHPDADQGPDLQTDKVLYLQCDYRGEGLNKDSLRMAVSDVLRDVHAAVEDWRAMQGQIAETIDELQVPIKNIGGEEAFEAAQFLSFLKDNNFTFLGYREHSLRHLKDVTYFDSLKNKSLGILRDDSFLLFDELMVDERIPDEVKKILSNPQPLLMVLKATRRATVHRNVHMDVIIIKKYDAKGQVEALRLFSGLFTAQCYAKPVEQIPYLKRKINAVMMRAGYEIETHKWRALKHVLDNYSRDELFQIEVDELYDHAMGIMRLNNRPEVDIFIRKDPLQRYFSTLVFLPKEQYDTDLREKVQSILEDELKGHVVSHYVMVDEKPLARIQHMVACGQPLLPEYDYDRIKARLVESCTPWFERLKEASLTTFGKQETNRLLHSLSHAFSVGYQDQVPIQYALEDLDNIQHVLYIEDMVVTLRRRDTDPDDHYRIKIYKRDEEARLSDLLPMLDRMGFKCLHEYTYVFNAAKGLPKVYLHELFGTIEDFDGSNLAQIEPVFAEAFKNIWLGNVDSDSFNTLTIMAGLNWREANIFRSLARYLDLASYPIGKRYIGQVLAKYPKITRRLCDLFLTRHDPKLDREKAATEEAGIMVEIDHYLDKVEKLDEDRVIRSVLTLIRESLRTNYFHVDAEGDPLSVFVLKFNASAIKDLPQPRPYREMFAFSNRFEAVHLRGGPIARGGIRWSDRYEDFRTEILGLVKAQMVKNAVIVPVGAKGGFICKNQPSLKTPQERQQEGIACYQLMVRTFLSITDNLIDGNVVPPANTVRHDEDDPYFVVAADKGTASFSDIANQISLDHNFWLGDAFASGGSKGYDHKGMGITARGAWECIKRHFRELGKDIQTEPFTAIGVGDMSGDVFGNGMLLSEQTLLMAAFDHRHIFIDPAPDAKKSFAERKRLFEKPGSSWMDYNPKLLSKGGAIYSRSDKSLELTPEIQALLDLTTNRVTPFELMQAILKARAELLYFGGIGTYLKASWQTHEQVGDKGNDPIRVDAKDLRCQVIGEGANLAVTQAARIEFAQNGGKCNTDFIDNSGGVDTSDHEVNIKILLQPMVNGKKLAEEDRNKLLEDMTDDVGSHVLKNNYDQSLALSLMERRAVDDLPEQAQYMRALEKQNLMDRKLEGLPDDETIQRLMQRHQGLTRAELAVLLAYSKINLFNELMDSSLHEDAAIEHQLFEYFPDVLQQRFVKEIPTHKLKKEIIATEVANVIINRMGSVFVAGEKLRTGVSAETIARAWLVVRSAFDMRTLWDEVDKLDNKIPADFQLKLYERMIDTLDQGVKWFVNHHRDDLSMEKLIPLYRDQLVQLQSTMLEVLPESAQKAIAIRQEQFDAHPALRSDVKTRLIQLPLLLAGCDVVFINQKTQANAHDVAKVYFALVGRLKLLTLRHQLESLPTETSWAQEVIDGMFDQLRSILGDLTQQFLATKRPAEEVLEWLELRQVPLQAVDVALGDIERVTTPDVNLLNVIVQRMNRLAY